MADSFAELDRLMDLEGHEPDMEIGMRHHFVHLRIHEMLKDIDARLQSLEKWRDLLGQLEKSNER